jgi:hypothetical protein
VTFWLKTKDFMHKDLQFWIFPHNSLTNLDPQ